MWQTPTSKPLEFLTHIHSRFTTMMKLILQHHLLNLQTFLHSHPLILTPIPMTPSLQICPSTHTHHSQSFKTLLLSRFLDHSSRPSPHIMKHSLYRKPRESSGSLSSPANSTFKASRSLRDYASLRRSYTSCGLSNYHQHFCKILMTFLNSCSYRL